MLSDVDTDFPSDWSAHAKRPLAGDEYLYLADATALAASILCYPWEPEDRLTEAGLRPAPVLPAIYDAFDDAGRPVQRFHDVFGMIVRQYIRTGSFDPKQHVHPLLLPTDPIHIDDWNEAVIAAEWVNVNRRTTRRVARLLAGIIADGAHQGKFETYVRPIGGGAAMRDPPAFAWHLDDPLRRLAACALRYDAPGDPNAPPDHLVFVDRVAFERNIRSLLPTHFTPLLTELEWMPPPGSESPTDRRRQLIAAMRTVVENAMDAAEAAVRANAQARGVTEHALAAEIEVARAASRRRWTRARLARAIEDANPPPHSPHMFEDARRRTIKYVGELAPRGRQSGEDE